MAEATGTVQTKVRERGTAAVTTTTDAAQEMIEQLTELFDEFLERIKALPVGDKNVGERTKATVESVSERIDVDQIQDQVAKLRHQMEGVVGSWSESFRPSTAKAPAKKAPAKKAPAKKAPGTKAAATKAPAKKAPAKKAPATKAAASKTAATKAPAKKAAASKTAATKAPAKKAAASKTAATKAPASK